MKISLLITGIIFSTYSYSQMNKSLIGRWIYFDSLHNVSNFIRFDSNQVCSEGIGGLNLLDDNVIMKDGVYELTDSTLKITWENKQTERRTINSITEYSAILDNKFYDKVLAIEDKK